MGKKDIVDTPLMKQYYKAKARHPDAILLFRVGDFYETFGDDALKTSRILGITLTKRSNGQASEVDLAGFPHHALETYLPKLIQSGQRVAVCDQLEDPKKAKRLVKRGITELVTPGTSLSDKILENRQNNYLCALHFEKNELGVALMDLSTGEFFTTQGNPEYVENLVKSFNPAEIIYSKARQESFRNLFGDKHYTFYLEDWLFSTDFAREKLLSHFKTKTLKGFGISSLPLGIIASGVILHYLEENQHQQLQHISKINRLNQEKYVWLDKFSIRNLELLSTPQEDGIPLIRILDQTVTPMGGRLLKKWLVLPLKELRAIKERQSVVSFFYQNAQTREKIQSILAQIGDLERLISKVAMKRVNPREVNQIKKALYCTEEILETCDQTGEKELKKVGDKLNPCRTIREKIEKEIREDPPVQTNKGGLIKEGIAEDLDRFREMAYSGKDYLVKLQQKEMEKTGIPSLKIGYNNVFGYYLEVRNTHKNKVPGDWVRKQTLVSAERYITEELKEYEEKILSSEEKMIELENQLYQDLLYEITNYVEPIQQNAYLLSYLDVLQSMAEIAEKNEYTQPEIDDDYKVEIKNARHPVIEQTLPEEEEYIPNDIYLDRDTQQMIILTGPNMSGKSAILRQTALIILLAQMGSFIPAEEAHLGLIDKIFTRVGASDNLSTGESTFMIEMTETASILNNISDRSLVLLDEIGRGTATYDGVSIAWSMTEYLHEHPARPKTLFATHYHELNEIARNLKRIRNFHVSVKEYQNKIIFLRKLIKGGSEHSFGINVAQMAGMPEEVIRRAKTILDELEGKRGKMQARKSKKSAPPQSSVQLKLFELEDPLLIKLKEEVEKVDINSTTPVEALMKLNQLRSLLKKGERKEK